MRLEDVIEFINKDVKSSLKDIDRRNILPKHIIGKMASLGLFGLTIPKKYGGQGLSLREFLRILEAISRECPCIANVIFLHSMSYDFILRFGSDEQKERYLPDIAIGRRILSLPFTEPQSGTDLANVKMRAVRKGEYYILNGVKTLATNGMYANLFIVIARTSEEKRRGLTLFIVEKEDGVKAIGPLDLFSARGAGIATLKFENVRVHKSRILGSEGDGFSLAVKGLALGRVPFSSIAIGVVEGALEEAVKWSSKRKTFGKPIFENQAICFPLAEVAAELRAIKAFSEELASMIERGEMPIVEASMIKLLSSELATKATRIAVQIMGGWGLASNSKVARLYRDAKALEIAEGTSEVQKMIIARQLLKEFKG